MLTVIFVVVLVSVVLVMEKVGMNLTLELVQLRALIVTVATNLANVASAKVLEKPKNFTQKRCITNPLCCTLGTRTAFSRARADQGALIGRNTIGIEYGVSVSAKLA